MKMSKYLFAFFLCIIVYSVLAFVQIETYDATRDKWIVPDKYRQMDNPVKEDLRLGKMLWNKHCKSCHGVDGLGDGPKAAQLDTPSGDFTVSEFQSQTDGSLFYKTLKGRDDMPSYEKKFPDEEDIWQLVHFIRTLK